MNQPLHFKIKVCTWKLQRKRSEGSAIKQYQNAASAKSAQTQKWCEAVKNKPVSTEQLQNQTFENQAQSISTASEPDTASEVESLRKIQWNSSFSNILQPFLIKGAKITIFVIFPFSYKTTNLLLNPKYKIKS